MERYPRSSPRSDHPRIRGEHAHHPLDEPGGQGSSPHTRGAPQAGAGVALSAGIIPAYAGSTRRSRRRVGRPADHPRIRGEHGLSTPTRQDRSGSSPHTRGAHSAIERLKEREGIIPAYAGSTSAARKTTRPGTDHPRIRGEHGSGRRCRPGGVGSSPHTRGALRGHARGIRDARIIPAYAGSTPCLPCARPRPADHPRIRGEHDRRSL